MKKLTLALVAAARRVGRARGRPGAAGRERGASPADRAALRSLAVDRSRRAASAIGRRRRPAASSSASEASPSTAQPATGAEVRGQTRRRRRRGAAACRISTWRSAARCSAGPCRRAVRPDAPAPPPRPSNRTCSSHRRLLPSNRPSAAARVAAIRMRFGGNVRVDEDEIVDWRRRRDRRLGADRRRSARRSRRGRRQRRARAAGAGHARPRGRRRHAATRRRCAGAGRAARGQHRRDRFRRLALWREWRPRIDARIQAHARADVDARPRRDPVRARRAGHAARP